jgi:hypothetical protein
LFLFYAALAGEARFALFWLTFFLFLFIYVSKKSGIPGSTVPDHG